MRSLRSSRAQSPSPGLMAFLSDPGFQGPEQEPPLPRSLGFGQSSCQGLSSSLAPPPTCQPASLEGIRTGIKACGAGQKLQSLHPDTGLKESSFPPLTGPEPPYASGSSFVQSSLRAVVCAHLCMGWALEWEVVVEAREELPARPGWGCWGRPWRISAASLQVEQGSASNTGWMGRTDLHTHAKAHIQVKY